jgi:predicted lipid-binding transport protein (Tim44 family)
MSFSLRNAFIAFFMAFFVMGVTAPSADAARLGGGSKLGKSYTVPKKSPTNSQQATPDKSNTAANAAAAGSKKGLMGGLLGGLLAGGLLSALFFGGAFDGIQIMDILIIAVLAFVIFKLFSSGKKAAAAQANQGYATQGAGGMGSPQTFQTNTETAGSSQEPAFQSSQEADGVVTTPPWFNKEAFLAGAQDHFLRLQKAWDAKDFDEIATYTSPELLEELKAERAKHPDDQVTETTSVMADLVKFEDYQDHVVVSVHFYGWIKENGEANPTEFGEYWHLNRDMTQPGADWFIVGLEPENR